MKKLLCLLVLLAVTALPEGCADWTDYVGRLGSFDGLAAQPTFHAAGAAMGRAGVVLLSAAAFIWAFLCLSSESVFVYFNF